METITIQHQSKTSKIIIGEQLKNVSHYIPDRKCVIITDENVYRYYKDQFPPWEVIIVGTGEKNKTLATLEYIYEKLLDADFDRSGFILGIGGGILCDIAGFAASTYLRGVPFGFVSTTLLSQVDASIGGKNGVNLRGYKNMVGVFNQPEFVICDFDLLDTLTREDYMTGFAEIIKHACIRNRIMFDYLEDHVQEALDMDKKVIYRLVRDSLVIKGGVVERDERESGERRILNFGHTYGHALEKLTGISHGEAISVGMTVAARLSVKRGLLKERDAQKIVNLLKKFGLPVESHVKQEEVFEVMKKDKKREGDSLHFVLLDEIGEAVVEKVSMDELRDINES